MVIPNHHVAFDWERVGQNVHPYFCVMCCASYPHCAEIEKLPWLTSNAHPGPDPENFEESLAGNICLNIKSLPSSDVRYSECWT